MIVTMQQIEAGVANYLDTELLGKLDQKSWQKVIVGSAISLVIKRYSSIGETYLAKPMFKELGIVDENQGIDIDLLRDVLKENVKDSGFEVPDIPLVGTLTFKKADIDSLYDYITTSKK